MGWWDWSEEILQDVSMIGSRKHTQGHCGMCKGEYGIVHVLKVPIEVYIKMAS
ncbi:hypothetical protein HPP92_018540 [Vanilla planifolia]|uniref:Uncharacterized protein n=1 Tax=Vanilla planifolia TaxID=51239 RepID=A0A835UNG4_VANPL|nr:hypothetical protein HPP92_018540 [Vanilla planifolia]